MPLFSRYLTSVKTSECFFLNIICRGGKLQRVSMTDDDFFSFQETYQGKQRSLAAAVQHMARQEFAKLYEKGKLEKGEMA